MKRKNFVFASQWPDDSLRGREAARRIPCRGEDAAGLHRSHELPSPREIPTCAFASGVSFGCSTDGGIARKNLRTDWRRLPRGGHLPVRARARCAPLSRESFSAGTNCLRYVRCVMSRHMYLTDDVVRRKNPRARERRSSREMVFDRLCSAERENLIDTKRNES